MKTHITCDRVYALRTNETKTSAYTNLHILKRALRHLPPACENANETWPSAPYEGITLGQDIAPSLIS